MRITNLFDVIKKKSFKNPPTLDSLFENYGALSFEKQMDFLSITKSNTWEFDLPNETLTFLGNEPYPISFYGSISKKTNHFLWLWESTFNLNINRSIENTNLISEYGKKNEIDEFTEGYFKINSIKMEKMAMVISHLTNANFYFIGDVNPGTFLVTVNDKSIERDTKETPVKLLNYFPKFIEKYPNIDNHKNALISYGESKGFDTYERKNHITLVYYAKYQGITLSDIVFNVEAEFDDEHKLLDIKGAF